MHVYEREVNGPLKAHGEDVGLEFEHKCQGRFEIS